MHSLLLYEATLQRCQGSQVSESCYTCSSEAKKGTFSTFLHQKGPRGVTLLGCGQLEDSEFKECTVFYCTEPPYKSAEAPRSQEVVVLATLKQKKALFLLFHTKRFQVCAFAGLWVPGELRV